MSTRALAKRSSKGVAKASNENPGGMGQFVVGALIGGAVTGGALFMRAKRGEDAKGDKATMVVEYAPIPVGIGVGLLSDSYGSAGWGVSAGSGVALIIGAIVKKVREKKGSSGTGENLNLNLA